MRTSGKTNSTPVWPNLHRTGPGREKHIKRGPKRALSCALSLALSLSLSPQHAGVLFSSRLWIYMPSPLEDGFSCYLLNKIELKHRAVTLICLRAIIRSVRGLKAVTRWQGFNVCHSKSLLWQDKNWGAYSCLTFLNCPKVILLVFLQAFLRGTYGHFKKWLWIDENKMQFYLSGIFFLFFFY